MPLESGNDFEAPGVKVKLVEEEEPPQKGSASHSASDDLGTLQVK